MSLTIGTRGKIILFCTSLSLYFFSKILRYGSNLFYRSKKYRKLPIKLASRSLGDSNGDLQMITGLVSAKTSYLYPNVEKSVFISNLKRSDGLLVVMNEHSHLIQGRIGFVEKMNPVIEFLMNIVSSVTKVVLNESSIFDDYLLNGDQVTVIGNFNKPIFNKLSQSYFEAKYISMGNKYSLLDYYEGIVGSLDIFEDLMMFSAFYVVFWEVCKRSIKYLRKFYDKKYLNAVKRQGNMKEICTLCKSSARNVVMLDCNHFTLCSDCFINFGEHCTLCKQKINSFYFLKDN